MAVLAHIVKIFCSAERDISQDQDHDNDRVMVTCFLSGIILLRNGQTMSFKI